MNVFVLQGEHPSVEGRRLYVYASTEGAVEKAAQIVNILRAVCPGFDPGTNVIVDDALRTRRYDGVVDSVKTHGLNTPDGSQLEPDQLEGNCP